MYWYDLARLNDGLNVGDSLSAFIAKVLFLSIKKAFFYHLKRPKKGQRHSFALAFGRHSMDFS